MLNVEEDGLVDSSNLNESRSFVTNAVNGLSTYPPLTLSQRVSGFCPKNFTAFSVVHSPENNQNEFGGGQIASPFIGPASLLLTGCRP